MKEKEKFLEFCDKHRKGIAVIIAWAIFMVCMSIFGVGLKHWYGHQATSEGWEYAHEVFFGIALVIPTWFITMYTYIYFRQKFAHTKYAVEVLFISLVIVAGVMMLLCAAGVGNDGIKGVFGSIYTAIGSFAFEGLTDKIADTHLATWFYGWAIYAGLTFLGIITTKSSYEVFSRIKLVLLPEGGKDVYVFSALTEETLALADSIVDENCKKRQKEIKNFYEYQQLVKTLEKINDELEKLNSKRKITDKDKRRSELECNKKENEARLNELKGALKKMQEMTKPCVIVFAGPSLKPFDRKDELCMQVMAKGYLYWTFSKGNKKSIAKTLHLNNKNAGDYNRRFVIFAFATENDVPAEEDNMDFVFKDIQTRIECEKSHKYDKLRIEYYILTKRTINYPAYILKNREFIFEYFKASDHRGSMNDQEIEGFEKYVKSSKNERIANSNYKEILQQVESEYYERFIINVWSEAQTIAKDAAIKSTDLVVSKIGQWAKEEKQLQKGQQPSSFNIWCLGFGSTAQEVAKTLYAQTSYVFDKGTSPEVHIWAFDKKMDEIEGLFKMEHPCSIVGAKGKQNSVFVNTQIDAIANAKSIPQDYIKEEMSYPIFHFKKWDCRSNDFLKKFDDAIGKTDAPDTEQPDVSVIAMGDDYADIRIANAIIQDMVNEANTAQPDVFVIAMGDDYANIRIANAIIQDTVNEAKTEKKQIIFVNVWDSKNNDLLLTCGGTKDEINKCITIGELKIYIIGNNEDVYSHKVVDVEGPSRYNANYSLMYDLIYTLPKKETDEENFVDKVVNFCKVRNASNGVQAKVRELTARLLCGLDERIHQGKETTDNNADLENSVKALFSNIKKHVLGDEAKTWVEEVCQKTSFDKINPDDALIIALISIAGISEKIGCVPSAEGLKEYNKRDIWERESNVLAELFYMVLAKISEKNENEGVKKYHRLSKMEHQRWCRVHWANGWIYENIGEKDEIKRHHKCLVPYKAVNKDIYLYDTINVLLAEAKKKP